jgi:hypothetical protein
MEFIEKAKIRIEHWINHNVSHSHEYQELARRLDSAGKPESANYIREMSTIITSGNEKLGMALQHLNKTAS